jgi:hemerythrin superfamily protein
MMKSLKAFVPTVTNMIRADHTHVLATFHQYEIDTSPGTKKALVNTICLALEIHAQLEEEIFYPAAREALGEAEGDDLLDAAEVEHASAKELIAQIEELGESDDLFEAKVKVLGEYVRHHVKEEEGELFPILKKTEMNLEKLGSEMEKRKRALMTQAVEEGDSTAARGAQHRRMEKGKSARQR